MLLERILNSQLSGLFRPTAEPAFDICFVRRSRNGFDVASRLGVPADVLLRLNPHVSLAGAIYGTQLLLVPRRSAASPRTDWLQMDFSFSPWPRRAQDFALSLDKARFLDSTWTPPAPPDLEPVTGTAAREAVWGRFAFRDVPGGDDIVITDDWEAKNIGPVQVPGLAGIHIPVSNKAGFVASGSAMRFNRQCHAQLVGLWADWVRYGLISNVLTFDGAFVPRYMRKASHTREKLSNHAWGTAFDIDAQWNPLGARPAALGQTGSTLALVELGHKWGFFWGGHFGSRRADGMHFEVAKIL